MTSLFLFEASFARMRRCFAACALTLMVMPLLAQAQTRIRVIHASADAPAVDIVVDGGVAFEGLRFKDYTNYTSVPAGSHTISINAAGTTTTVFTTVVNLSDNIAYSFYAVGKLNPGGGRSTLNLLGTGDDLSAPPSGSTKVRVIHAASTAPDVDVYVTSPFAKLPDSPALSGVPYTLASGYLTVPAADYQARVTVAGTKTVAIDSRRVRLIGGTVRTIAAIDPSGTGKFELLVPDDVN